MLINGPCGGDCLALCPAGGRNCWVRPAGAESHFGYLPPGRYLLELARGRSTLCRLGLSLPPGANVTLWLDPAAGEWSWRRELFHCCYNQE